MQDEDNTQTLFQWYVLCQYTLFGNVDSYGAKNLRTLHNDTPRKHRDANIIKTTTSSALRQHNVLQAYAPTEVFYIAVRKLQIFRKLVLVSGQGCGKTCLGKELLSYFGSTNSSFHKKTPIIMRQAHDWYDLVDPEERIVVLLDDIFGKVCLETSEFTKWEKMFQDIYTCINDKSTSVCVIITIRKNIFRNVINKLKRHDLFSEVENFVITLDEKTLLSKTCKRDILLRHFANPQSNSRKFCIQGDHSVSVQASNSIIINDSDIEAILSAPSVFAFPLCCREYVNNQKYFSQGPLFFTRPVDILFPDIRCLCEKDEHIYFLLTSILFSRSQKLNLIEISRLFGKEIADFCSIHEPVDKLFRILKNKIRELTDIYVNDTNSIITFVSEVLSEVMLRIIGDIDMSFLIRKTDMSILKLYTTMHTVNMPSKLFISPNYFEACIERFLLELQMGNVEEVGSYEGMDHEPFVDEFVNALHREENYHRAIRQTDNKSNKTLFLSACESDPPRYQLIKSFLDRPPMKKRLFKRKKISTGLTRQLYSTFERACSKGNTQLSAILIQYISVDKLSNDILLTAAKSGSEDVFNLVHTCKTWPSKISRKAVRKYKNLQQQ